MFHPSKLSLSCDRFDLPPTTLDGRQALIQRPVFCVAPLPDMNHLFHLPLLHADALPRSQIVARRARVEKNATTTLKKVIVDTSQPSSLPLNSHLSSLVGQISFSQIGESMGQVTGLAMHTELCSSRQADYVFITGENPSVQWHTSCSDTEHSNTIDSPADASSGGKERQGQGTGSIDRL